MSGRKSSLALVVRVVWGEVEINIISMGVTGGEITLTTVPG